jgi:TPR repeat protein
MSDPAPAVAIDVGTLRHAARAGQRDAQLLLAQASMEGRGMAADPDEAFHWYSVAANLGEPMAMNMLGRCHELGQGTAVDLALAAVWYRKAAEAGLDWGMYNLAHLLASGNGIATDRAAAYRWYLQAARLGHAGAMNFVGRFHEQGWEVAPDKDIAMAWYRRSAQADDVRGQANYASMLADQGRIGEAMAWLARGLRAGSPAFVARLRSALAESPHPQLRALVESPAASGPAERLIGFNPVCTR